MNKGVDRAGISGVLAVIAVQSPSVDRDAGRQLFGVSQHVVNGADAPKGTGWVVLQSVHHEVGRRGHATGVCIPRAVAQDRHCNVGAVTAV